MAQGVFEGSAVLVTGGAGYIGSATAEALLQAGHQVTDEASALELMGLAPKLVESDPSNLKVTFPRDLELARLLLGR